MTFRFAVSLTLTNLLCAVREASAVERGAPVRPQSVSVGAQGAGSAAGRIQPREGKNRANVTKKHEMESVRRSRRMKRKK